MAYKVNPINFRLGITRVCRFVNNVYLTNFSFLWLHYLKYEKLLFLFFYKYKFWVVSSKIVNIKSNLILIFCNFYKLRWYFNDKPVRGKKKKKTRFEPDGLPDTYSWLKHYNNIFFKKKYINKIRNLFLRNNYNTLYEVIKNNLKIKKRLNFVITKYNNYLVRKFIKITKRTSLSWKLDFFYFNKENKKNYELNFKVFKRLSNKYNKKTLNVIKLNIKKLNLKKLKNIAEFNKKIFKIKRLKNKRIEIKVVNKKKLKVEKLTKKELKTLKELKNNYNTKYLQKYINKKFLNKYLENKSLFKNFLNKYYIKSKHLNKYLNKKYINLIYFNPKWNLWTEDNVNLIDNIREKYSIYNLSEDNNSYISTKEWYICQKIYFFHLSTILKTHYFKKNIILKLRDIHNLKEFKKYSWEDALRTVYLLQQQKKHFIRTIFRDFLHLHRISYLMVDAFLFSKIIKNLFEMTKFHKRLIYLLKFVMSILSTYYDHLLCKVQLKGKMQYKKRTKTIILFKQSMPLNQLNKTIEYCKDYAITPFGVLGIKTWIYFLDTMEINENE